ncbi:MAG: hypothetical protein DCC71_00810 [Proteobacteria bacterium]|nr:MAG: hypothetical protein DCC71_00810 [Pseudomonadota bacterium]
MLATVRALVSLVTAIVLGASAPALAQLAPEEGPGGPVLVVVDGADPFGFFYAEILRTEGLNAFAVADVSALSQPLLDAHEVVLLAQASLSAPQVQLLTDFVVAGGKLVAMRPDPQLAGLLGLGAVSGTLADGYLLVDDATAAGQGIVAETMQFHDVADLWTTAGASAIAQLYDDATTPTSSPAVTLNAVGMNGGMAAAFTYDLARSVAWTRQGNPAWAGLERDGQGAIRPWELHFSIGASAGQPHYVDVAKIHIPQADEQQRLLANLIVTMSALPMPRFWYFPSDHAAAVVMTGDQHGCCQSSVDRLTTYLSFDPPGCSVEDWECVRSTSYVYPGPGLSDAEAVAWDALGFELALHANTGCGNWSPASLAAAYSSQLAGFAAQFPSLPAPATHRLHCVVWSDWATQPAVELAHGIRLDTTYYYPGASGGSVPGSPPGPFTGSGMPMRYVELDGSMIDVYQAVTQMTDESGQSYPFTVDTLLNRATGPEEFYGAFTVNMHQDNPVSSGALAIVQSAQARGVPIVSARQMLTWLDARNASAFTGIAWNGSELAFAVDAAADARNLRGMLPFAAGGGQLTALTRGGAPVAFQRRTIKGIEYAVFDASDGNYAASYEPDTTPPAISGLAAVAHPDATAQVTWQTDESADSLVQYGTAPDALVETAAASAFVTSHAITLSALAPNTTYYYRVTSSDTADNAATAPPVGDAPASFTTPGLVCIEDATDAELAGGAGMAGVHVARSGDGELLLAPAAAAELEGDTLPDGWETAIYPGGSGATLGGGRIALDGARLNTVSLFEAGRSLEFVATFAASANQHAGFAITLQEVGWAIFSTAGAGTSLRARTHTGASAIDTDLGGAWLGAPHRYRIDWSESSVDFYIDGTLVATHAAAIPLELRPIAGDSAGAPGGYTVDWMRMTPYADAGTLLSRVIDLGAIAAWDAVSWDATTPAGTSLGVRVRTGDTPAPDASWTSFTPIAGSGGPLGGSSRYLQYAVDLGSTDPDATPELDALRVTCDLGPDGFPPAITALAAAPGPDGTTAQITWTTDEPADSHVDYGTSPDALTASAGDSALVTDHGVGLSELVPGTTYYYRATSADAASNAASAPAGPPASFVANAAPAQCGADDAIADFAAGAHAGTHAAATAGGEVILAPTEAAEFETPGLPPGWQAWEGTSGAGTFTIANGSVVLDAGQVRTDALYGPGRTLEAVATFGATNNHHVGFGLDLAFTARWAIFSTRNSTTNLFARTHDGSAVSDVDLGAGFLGAPHRYRIDWKAASVDFFIDGALVHSQPVAIAGDMRPIASDSLGGATLSVDWLRMTPYAGSGTFESRVFDAGARADWLDVAWSADEPVGASVALWARTGETAAPDASWSDWTFVPASGQSLGATARYAQVRADLATSDALTTTPALADVTLQCTLRPACSNGLDDDGDGLVDAGVDPGCTGESDPSETSVCSDGVDNDGDGLVDFPADPGCLDAHAALENPRCDDDLDNDGDGFIDWDGGAGGGTPDPHCQGVGSRKRENPQTCGLGAELALLLPLFALGARRARRRSVAA